jgi:predicted nucleic acid-binding protein
VALVVLDAGIVVAALDAGDAHHRVVVDVLGRHAEDELLLPASALAEALVAPTRRGVAGDVRAILRGLGLVVVPLDEEIAASAAALRAAQPSIRLPDALVAATGDVLGADVVLTTDRRVARLPRCQLVT